MVHGQSYGSYDRFQKVCVYGIWYLVIYLEFMIESKKCVYTMWCMLTHMECMIKLKKCIYDENCLKFF
jgi:hypothetical protein